MYTFMSIRHEHCIDTQLDKSKKYIIKMKTLELVQTHKKYASSVDIK